MPTAQKKAGATLKQCQGGPGLFLFSIERSCVELDEAADGALAHRAELRHFVGAHAAVLHRAVHALAQIASCHLAHNSQNNFHS